MSFNIYIEPGVTVSLPATKQYCATKQHNIGFNTNLVNDDWGYWLLCEWCGGGRGWDCREWMTGSGCH